MDLNRFTGPIDNALMSNFKLLQKISLYLWCFVERALLANAFLSDSSNYVMILAMLGPHVSQ